MIQFARCICKYVGLFRIPYVLLTSNIASLGGSCLLRKILQRRLHHRAHTLGQLFTCISLVRGHWIHYCDDSYCLIYMASYDGIASVRRETACLMWLSCLLEFDSFTIVGCGSLQWQLALSFLWLELSARAYRVLHLKRGWFG